MKNFKIGLQLYSVRDDIAKDMDSTLGKVKEMGYDYVEFAGGYAEKTAEEVRALLDKHELDCVSVHQAPTGFTEDAKGTLGFITKLGIKYCALPWMPFRGITTEEEYREVIKDVKPIGELLKARGIKFLYHNHDFEFKPIGGKLIIDRIFDEVGLDIINPEFDTCWVKYAGYEPVEYLKKYKGYCEVVHLKDFNCLELGAGPAYALIDASGKAGKNLSFEDNKFSYEPLGMGRQNFPEILAACEEVGSEYLIVEQDNSTVRPPLEAVKISRDYLKSLGI